MVIIPVAVEKLASEKSAKIKTRQEAPQTIFSSRPDIFYLSIFAHFEKKGLFSTATPVHNTYLKVNPDLG
jgi:hypothetical protein